MYGEEATAGSLDWSWVEAQLTDAGAYWTVTTGLGHPHPRPVWGVWSSSTLHLSVGSPRLAADLGAGGPVTVHLGSVTDVVIVEGRSTGPSTDAEVLAAYNAKYEWEYTVAEYGPLTVVAPTKVIAWRSAGWAGRGSFRQTGRWRFPPHAQ